MTAVVSSADATASAFGYSAGAGLDWSERVPRIVEAMRALGTRSALIDGEAVVAGDDGVTISARCIDPAYCLTKHCYPSVIGWA